MPPKIREGLPLKKGQIVRVYESDEVSQLFEVQEDVEWNRDFNRWGSVWLVGSYPPLFTHKGKIEVFSKVCH